MAFGEDALYANKCSSDEEDNIISFDQIILSDDDSEAKYAYEVLSTEQLVQFMRKCVDEVSTVMEITPMITRILLNHFKWDKEKLYEKYFSGNQETLFHEVHITNPHRPNNLQRKLITVSEFSESCLICFDETIEAERLMCGHQFCNDCWNNYLTVKIMDEGIGHTITCAAHKCDMFIDDQTVLKLLRDDNVKLRYQHLITNSFVECNRLLKWCPQPDCNHVIKVEYVDMQGVTCNCGYAFCFLCYEDWHDPINCKMLERWQKNSSSDIKSTVWIEGNTKKCPKCKVAIEKNGGCNHMLCGNRNCRAEFCWICLTEWNMHGYNAYNCNRYQEPTSKGTLAELNLQRYSFYHNRYRNQKLSIKLEKGLYLTAKEKFIKNHCFQSPILEMEMSFLQKATDALYQCRLTLMHTYIFAYYVQQNNQVEIFLNNQKDLEIATEKLSEYLERDIEESAIDIKQMIQDKYIYCKKRCKVLLSHVHEGYEMMWWKFNL